MAGPGTRKQDTKQTHLIRLKNLWNQHVQIRLYIIIIAPELSKIICNVCEHAVLNQLL